MEYSGEPYEFSMVTWKEINGTDYDILQYGEVKCYVFNGEKYVEIAVYIGFHVISCDIAQIAGGNSLFGNGLRRRYPHPAH